MHKIYLEQQIDVKLPGITKLLPLSSLNFRFPTPIPVAFTDLKMSKIECENYACSPNPVTYYAQFNACSQLIIACVNFTVSMLT